MGGYMPPVNKILAYVIATQFNSYWDFFESSPTP